jgi:hypothetical protein
MLSIMFSKIEIWFLQLKQTNKFHFSINITMNTESYRVKSAINNITTEILASYEKIGKTTEEVRMIVATALEKYGGESMMGSSLLWANYGRNDVMNMSLVSLGLK